MVSTRKKRNQRKRQSSQLYETLNDFIIGNGTKVIAMENETLEQQRNGSHIDFEVFDNSSSQTQVVENNIVNIIRGAVDKAVLTVKNRMRDAAILKAMDKMVIARLETAVRSITGSTGHEPISDVQNPDRRDFLGNVGNAPLMSASSRLDLNTSQNRNDETRNEENFDDGGFLTFRPSYDRRVPTHHSHINFYRQKCNGYVESMLP